MSKYRKWVLALGIMTVTPGLTMAGSPSFPFFKSKKARSAKEQSPATYSNQKTADEVAAALRNANLSGFDIAIEHANGTATLTGSIADKSLKGKATQIISRVPGVQRVDNRLKVVSQGQQFAGTSQSVQPVNGKTVFTQASAKEGPKSNQAKAQEIANTITRAGLSRYDVEVRYQNGMATLSGTVGDASQQAWAAQLAAKVPGVTSVNNQLTVAGQTVASAGQPNAFGNAPTAGYGQPSPIARATYQTNPNQPPMPPQSGAAFQPASNNFGHPVSGASQAAYNMPHFPNHAWPAQASYPNYSQVSYPQEYSASAWPYIGPFYPYPQVPLGWRKVALEWDDGSWKLNFRPRTDRWWWFLNPQNW